MAVDTEKPTAFASARIGDERGLRGPHSVVGAVFFLALAVRLMTVLFSHGGLWGNYGYDGSVYYAAADAVTFGRMPYQDFVLLHPPALMLALTPFAVLGRLVGDHAGFVAATLSFQVLGALNAALVVGVARKAGLALIPAMLGGTFYAVWPGAVGAEYAIRLEPLGSFAVLCAFLAVYSDRDRADRGARRPLELAIAGAALGIAISTKIWWIVPAAIILGWQCWTVRRKVAPMLVGVTLSLLAINGAFFLNAPGLMWRRVVLDQLGRPRSSVSFVERIEQLASLRTVLRGSDPAVVRSVLLAVAALVMLACALAWRIPRCRVLVVMLGAQLTVLCLAPSYFSFYSGFAAASASLVLAAATDLGPRHRTARAVRVLAAGVVVAALVGTLVQALVVRAAVSRFPGAHLAAAVRTTKCVMSDSPMALIELNALSRGLGRGCPNWVDVTGRTYDVDKPAGAPVRRSQNLRWQRDLRRYLLSGGAVILIRSGTGASAQTKQVLSSDDVLATANGYTVYRTRASVLPSPETHP